MSHQSTNRDWMEALHSEHRLLAILRALVRLPEYTGNAALMRDRLNAIGLVASWETVRADLCRIKEMGLAEVYESPASAWRVTLTERGIDVAEGRSVTEGIRRPEPGCQY